MAHQVFCQKYQEELEGLPFAPLPGPLGERIFREISQRAWKAWLGQSTMVINEYRLNPAEPKARKMLRDQMQAFLFDGGAPKPSGYKPEEKGPDAP